MLACLYSFVEYITSIGHQNYCQASKHQVNRDKRQCIQSLYIVVWHVRLPCSLLEAGHMIRV